jgi:hypothetical protein
MSLYRVEITSRRLYAGGFFVRGAPLRTAGVKPALVKNEVVP